MGKRYYLLLFGYLVSSLGNWLYRLTLPLLVLKLTGSALNTAALYALEYVPFLLLSLPGGVYADRFDRRRLLIAGDLVAGAIAAGIGVIVTVGITHLWPLYVTAFLLGCVEPVYHPAFQSLLPELVKDEKIEQANAWMQSGDNIVSLVGPVAAGAAVVFLGYQSTVFLDAGTFVVSALAIMLIGRVAVPDKPSQVPVAAPPPGRRRMAADLREGARYVFVENRVLLAGALLFTGTNVAIWLVQANFVYYLSVYLHLSPTAIGAILSAQGVGAILGAAVSGRLIRNFAPGRVILGYTGLAGAATLLLVPVRNPIGIAVIWGLLFGFSAVNVVAWFTLRQRIVPRHLLGRVVATTRMLSFASIPFAALLGGSVENALHNVYILFLAAGILRIAMALVGLRGPLGRSSTRASVAAAVPDPAAS